MEEKKIMYLSRVLIKGEQFRNPYEIHRALWKAFPEAPNQERDFLFRVEQKNLHQAHILMQSNRLPETKGSIVEVLAVKNINLNLPSDIALHFLLVANPVKTIIDDQARLNSKGYVKKCRVPLIKEEEQIAWLQRKLTGSALLESVEIEKQLPLNFRKAQRRGKVQPYMFKGVLNVQNGQALEQLTQQGIGPAKSFGCGLLSLAVG